MAYCRGLTKQSKKIGKHIMTNFLGGNKLKPRGVVDATDWKCRTFEVVKNKRARMSGRRFV